MRACLKYIITLLFVSLNIQSSASIIRLYNFESDLITENTIPKRLYIDGGYIDINFNTNTTSYKYYIYDHQGSVRAVLNSSGTVIQSTDYSAYGVPSTRYQMNADNRFHLGLEWQPMKGLYGYYNNARFRDALLGGTFLQQDPLAEKYYPFSPYHYGMNNPLKFTDKTGKFSHEWQAQTAKGFQTVIPGQQSGIIKFNNTENNAYRYTFNTTSKENGEYVVTTHYGVSRSLANNLQNTGDAMVVGGFATALTIEGAEAGFATMAIGNGLSTTGSLLEMGVDLLNSDFGRSSKEAVSTVINIGFDTLWDVFSPSKKLGNKLMKGSADVKLTIADFIIDKTLFSEGNSETEKD